MAPHAGSFGRKTHYPEVGRRRDADLSLRILPTSGLPTIRSTRHIPITDFPVPNFQNTQCPWRCLIFFNPACHLLTTVNGSGPRASADNCTTRMEKKPPPERGDMTFRTVIETMGGHDLNHLNQLETAAA
jgi:hypothetical protein